MSYQDCLSEAIKEKKMSQAQADRLQQLAYSLKEIYRKGGQYTEPELTARANQVAVKTMLGVSARRKNTLVKQILATKNIDKVLESHPSGAIYGAASLMVKSYGLAKGDAPDIVVPVATQAEVLFNKHLAHMADVVDYFRPRIDGVPRNLPAQELLSKALGGEEIESVKLKEFAARTRETLDNIRNEANDAGLNIPKRENYLPHGNYDPFKLIALDDDPQVAAQKLSARILPRLGREEFSDYNGNPLSDEEADDLLKKIYVNVVSQGDAERAQHIFGKITKEGKKTKLAPQTENAILRQFEDTQYSSAFDRDFSSQVLPFKTVDDWLQTNKEFSSSSPLQTLYSYMRHMCNEIALARVFGSNRDIGFEYTMARTRELQAKFGAKNLLTNTPENIYNYLTGKAMRMKDLRQMKIAKTFRNIRQLGASAFLASTPLTALTDVARTLASASSLHISIGKILGLHLKLLLGRPEITKIARELGISTDLLLQNMGQRYNEMADNFSSGLPNKFENITVRSNGLNRWTRSLHSAAGLVMNMKLADDSLKSFSDLSDKDQALYKKFGLNEKNWDAIKEAIVNDKAGYTYLDPKKLSEEALQKDPLLFEKINGMVLFSRDRAIPSNDPLINSMFTGSLERGRIAQELTTISAKQFQTYFLGSIIHTLDEVQHSPMNESLMAKVSYITKFTVTGLLLGAVSTQLYTLTHFREPEDMSTVKFWMKSAAKGLGGMGFIADTILNASDDEYEKIASLCGGVVGFMVASLFKIVSDAALIPIKDRLTNQPIPANWGGNTLEDIIQTAQSFTPCQTYYTQTAIVRLVYDQLRKIADVRSQNKFDRQEENARKNGTRFLWHPGKLYPTELPNLKTAFGGR